MSEKPSLKKIEKTIGIAFLLLIIFASPLTQWWSNANLPWYTPFLFWFIVILLTALANSSSDRDDV